MSRTAAHRSPVKRVGRLYWVNVWVNILDFISKTNNLAELAEGFAEPARLGAAMAGLRKRGHASMRRKNRTTFWHEIPLDRQIKSICRNR